MISEAQQARAWEHAQRPYRHVLLNRPRIYSEGEKGLGEEIACIDMASKQIYIDEANLEQRVGLDKLPAIESHEIGHHKHCPYDLRNLVRLVGHAYKETKSINRAQTVENQFADLLVNADLQRKGVDIASVYRRLSKGSDSRFWDFYMSTFEQMTGQRILDRPAKEEARKDAMRLGDLLSKAIDSSERWPKTVREYAKAAKKYMEEDKQEAKDDQGDMPGQAPETYAPAEVPQIDHHSAKDFLPFKKSGQHEKAQSKAIEGEIKGLAKELGQGTYKKAVAGLGLGSKRQANLWFYRDLVREYMMEMPCTHSGYSSPIPNVAERWRTSDPVERLDVEYTLSNYGIILPNITTYQRVSKVVSSMDQGGESPDLLIVLDSSGSMADPMECLSFALLSSMIASKAALDVGRKVGVINFSCDYTTLQFTNDSYKVDETLSIYYNGGTIIPGEAIKGMVSRNPYPTHVLMITDTGIANLDQELPNLEAALKRGRSGGTIFLDTEPEERTDQLANIGYDIIFTRNFDELAQATLAKSKAIYQGGTK